MKKHVAIWLAALIIPGGLIIAAAYYLRTSKWFVEDN